MNFSHLSLNRVVPLLLIMLAIALVAAPLAAQSDDNDTDSLTPVFIGQQPGASATPAATAVTEHRSAHTVHLWMHVHAEPAVLSPVVDIVPARTEMLVLTENEDGMWVQVQIDDLDEPAWVPKVLLVFEEDESTRSADEASSETDTDADPDPCENQDDSEQADSAGQPEDEEPEAEEDPLARMAAQGPVAVTQPLRMNVRRGPGTEYPVVTVAERGTLAQIIGLGPQDQWYQVELESLDQPVWLFQGLTELVGSLDGIQQLTEEEIPPRPTPTPIPTAAPTPTAAPPPTAAPSPTAAPPPAPVPSTGGSFGYGIQAHMVHTGDQMIDLVMDNTQELGFSWVKQQIEWKVFESQQGQYGFGDIHPIVNRANARGINLLFSVVNAPDWAREPGFDGSVGGPPANPQVFANFLGRLASEFCGSSVKAIEVWNEQNLHYEWGNRPINPSEYMALLRPAYGAIKSACPSMLVISGALTPAGDNGSIAMDDFRYFEAMLQQGLRNYADGFGAHPSGYNVPPSHTWQTACAAIQESGNSFNGACDNPHHSWSFRSTMEGYRNLAVRYGAGGQRIWPTEFGWAAGGRFHDAYAYADDNSYEEQANWTVEAYRMMRNWGWVGPAFLWNLNFRVVADGTEKAQWGIVRNDWSPLPVFYALRDMPK